MEVQTYTISKLAKIVGLSAPTLRFYEDEGIINPAKRSRAGYRLYNESSIPQVLYVKKMQELGFSLKDIKKSLTDSDQDFSLLISQTLAEVTAQLNQLTKAKEVLLTLTQKYKKDHAFPNKVDLVLGLTS
jgi:DNA-binding transcriptional MerR regulator